MADMIFASMAEQRRHDHFEKEKKDKELSALLKRNPMPKSFEVVGYIVGGEIYCKKCADIKKQPIFADDEDLPVTCNCNNCGEPLNDNGKENYV